MIYYFAASLYWYLQESYWIEQGEKFISCAIELVMAGKKDEIDGTCPHIAEPAVFSNATYFSTMLIVLAGIVLQCTSENVKFWRTKWENCKCKKGYDNQTSDYTY